MSVDDLQISLGGAGEQTFVGDGAVASSSSVQLEPQIMTWQGLHVDASKQSRTRTQSKKKLSKILGASGASSDVFTILPSGHHKKWCRVCIEAGQDGNNCPGSGNCSMCLYR